MTANLMSYSDFNTHLLAQIRREFSPDYDIHIERILKNNSIQLDALMICAPDCNLTPNIYLNYYYERYQKGSSFACILEEVLDCYRKRRSDSPFDADRFRDFAYIRKHLVFRLLNREDNRNLLADVPHIDFLDLAIVFSILLKDEAERCASVLIHKNHLPSWGNPTAEDLLAIAESNSPRLLPHCFRPLSDFLREEAPAACPDDSRSAEPPLFVLCNRARLYGAASVLYPGLLSGIAAQLSSDLIVIPSSIHEVLLTPYDRLMDPVRLNEMVVQVNTTQVPKEDILSDHVYYFDRRRGVLGLDPPAEAPAS